MPSQKGRAEKVVSIRLPQDQLDLVQTYRDAGHAQTLTAAVQDLVKAGLAAHQDAMLEEHRRAVGTAGLRRLAMDRATNAYRLVFELSQSDPEAARSLAIELLQQAARIVALADEAALKGVSHE